MRNRILITSLVGLCWFGAAFAQTAKTSLSKTSALAKAFQPNASKAENLETMRRTLGISSSVKLDWKTGAAGVDTLSILDDFNRSEINEYGQDWAFDTPFWEIKDGELVLKPEAIYEWRYLATYLPVHNDIERRIYSVSYRWGKNADALGIREGAHAIMMDRPSNISTGYWIWHRTNWEQVWMWVIRDGTYEDTPGTGREIDKADAQVDNPVAGDVVNVIIRPEKRGNFFDYYVNNKFNATVQDPNKEFPTNQSNTWYVGLFIHGQSLNNQVDDFKVTWLQGDGFTPGTIEDLNTTNVTATSVTLEWTAPGDNGFDGQAKSYDIRYSTNRITTDADFDAATAVPDQISPSIGGSPEKFIIGGLPSGKTYYFAIKTSDEAGNISGLSNETSGSIPALLPSTDTFNRANGALGSGWGGEVTNIQIRNNAAQKTGTVNGWSPVVFQNVRNVIEVSLKYASTATPRAIGGSGVLLMANAPAGNLNGYLIQRDNGFDVNSTDDDETRLWLVENGRPEQVVDEGPSRSGRSPKAGSKVTVRIIDLEQRYFYVYVDGVFDRVLRDERSTYNGLYAGFMLEDGYGEQNAIDEFTCGAAPGKPKTLSLVSGDNQLGEIGKFLPQPLAVALIDSFNNPLAGVPVRFTVTAGTATIPLPLSPDGNLRIEAEDALIAGPIEKRKDSDAAAGEYIVYPVGKTEDASATFTFEIKQAGNYRVWTRSLKTGTVAGSWNVKIDNGASFVYDVFRSRPNGSWRWDEVSDRGNGTGSAPQFDPKVVNFSAGEHKIIFMARYEDTRLDKIIITADPNFFPEGKEESGFLTDFAGQTSAAVKLGESLLPITVEARYANVKPVAFKITPLSNAKPKTISLVSGMSQSGPAGQTLQPFKVGLKDANGNAVAGQQVTWVVTSGNGTLSQYTNSTDLSGTAQTVLMLGNAAATNTVEARANLVDGPGKVIFTATTTAGLAANMLAVSGNNQNATVHTMLPLPLLVKVTTTTGQAVSNFPVEFKTIRGGGSLSSNLAINNESFENGASVPANWDLEGTPNASEVALSANNPRSGTKNLQVNASRDGVGVAQNLNYPAAGNFTLSFYAKVASGTARVIWRTNGVNGAAVDKIIDITPLATGNAWMLYTISATNTTTTPRALSFRTAANGNFQIDDVKISRNTDNNGQASIIWTLGDTAMTQAVRAEAKIGNTTLAGSPSTFSALAKAGSVKKLVLLNPNQNGAVGKPVTVGVRVSDDYVNGVPDFTVKFTIKSGDANFDNNLKTLSVKSNAGGLANANLVIGATARDTIKVEASATGLKAVIANIIIAVPSQVTKGNSPTVGSAGVRMSKPLIVRVADAAGKPISGYPVLFTITQGGGSFNGSNTGTFLTDAAGEAKAYPILGVTPGALNKIQARITYNGQNLPAQPIVFNVRIVNLKEVTLVSGNNQTGNTCEPLAQPFKVKVTDSLNVGVKGQIIKFTVTAGNGNFGGVISKEVQTDSLGIAQVPLTLGDKPIANKATASTLTPLKGSPITFTATAQAGGSATLRHFSPDTSSKPASSILTTIARVTDKCGVNGVANVPITFIVKSGGGKINGKDTVVVSTNAEGKAQVPWTLGPLAGTYNNKLQARAAFTNTALTFVASATSSGARSMTIQSGNKQTGRAGERLADRLVVRVIDGINNVGNPVAGHRVRFVVQRGGGRFNSGSQDTTITTDEKGEARVFWTLGGAVGQNAQEVRATATNNSGGNLINSPLIFTANVNGNDPSAEGSIFKVIGATPVPADGVTKCKVTVNVRDKYGNAVSGLAVTFVVSGGPNFIEQPTGLTDTQGAATCQFSSTRAELKTVTAKIIGGIDLNKGINVLFTPGPARSVQLITGNNQACNVQAATPKPLTVKIVDQYQNGVPNYEVRFTTKNEGRILESAPIKTDDKGQAYATFIAGANTGIMQTWAEATGLQNSPVIFTTTVARTAAQRLLAVSGNNQSGMVNQRLSEPLVVRVTDAFGRPVFGTPVKISVTFGDGVVDGRKVLTMNTDALGEVNIKWRLGPHMGVNTLRFESEGLIGSPVDFRAEAGADRAAVLTSVNCGSVVGPVTGTTTQPLTVRVTDNSGNGVDSVNVLFELIQGVASFSSRDQIRLLQVLTRDGGFASAPVTFGTASGYRKVRVSAEGLQNSPLVCSVYGRALAAKTMEIIARTNNQKGTKGKPLNFPLQVLVKDQHGNPVPNETINFLVTAGGGDFNGVNPLAAKTDSNGIAASPWMLGKFTVVNEALATRNGLLPSTLNFKATGADNNFPVFADAPDRRVREGDVIEFAVAATDADRDPLKYGVKNLPAGAEFDSLGTQVFRWGTMPTSAGRYEVSFVARDGKGGVDEEIVVIEVGNRNRSPIIYSRIPVGNLPTKIDTTLDIVNGVGTMTMRVNASDPDGDMLSYRWFVNGKFTGTATNTFLFKRSERFTAVEAWVFDQEDTTRTTWTIKVPVELSSFSAALTTEAISGGQQVRLEWSTGAEMNNAGFHVLRSPTASGRYEKINAELIPAAGDGNYYFVDANVEAGGKYFYKLQDIDLHGNLTEHGPIAITVAAPASFSLQQNYPNPFNPTTQLRYEIPRAAHVSLVIFNSLGQEVRRLVERVQPAGYHQVTWNGRDERGKPVPSGLYHYRLQVGEDFVSTKRMLMAK